MRFRTIAFGALFLAGCAAQPLSTALSPDHPASPAAPEAAPFPASMTLSDDPLGVAPSDEYEPPPISGHHHSAAGGRAHAPSPYRCPMHPDVRSDQPGKCPVCGMTLQQEHQ